MVFNSHKFSPPCVCGVWWYFHYIIFGEKIYIETTRKPSKINRSGNLTIADLHFVKEEIIMKKHRFLATTLLMVMTLSLVMPNSNGAIVQAEENDTEILDVEFVDSLEGIAQEALQTVSADVLPHDGGMQHIVPYEVSINDGEILGEVRSSRADGISSYASENSVTQSFTGTIEKENGLSYLLVTLAPGDILQATLSGPDNKNINYDLLLYTYNDGLDICVAGSTLETYMNTYYDEAGNKLAEKSLEEGISYINSGDANQTYALIVYASTGYSSTENFVLTLSIDEEGYYDASEPNDSPFSAVTISVGAIITGCNLNVINDQDWFVCNVPSTINALFSLNNSNYCFEVYSAVGSAMKLVNPKSGRTYSLNPGNYYIRVCNRNASFTSSDYTLTMQPYGTTPAKLKVSFNGDLGTAKAAYPEGSYHRFKNTLSPSVLVMDASGYPVPFVEVTMTWLGEDRDDSENEEQSVFADSNGIADFNYRVIRESRGNHSYLLSGPVATRHYYDIDGIIFNCGKAIVKQIVYHFEQTVYVG